MARTEADSVTPGKAASGGSDAGGGGAVSAAPSLSAELTLTEVYERRLARLGFDIHDGPLQDLTLLGEDVELLRRQLSDVLAQDVRAVMLGRLDDLDAQLVALESSLRRISTSLRSPLATEQSLAESLADMVRGFEARSAVEPVLRIDGDLDDLTDSQQMALLSIAREALNNVREHSEASEVEISLQGGPTSIELTVQDNGMGFDVEDTLVRAARGGHLGLVGVLERARLLGGSSRIESKPGRNTKISVTLPRWRPSEPQVG